MAGTLGIPASNLSFSSLHLPKVSNIPIGAVSSMSIPGNTYSQPINTASGSAGRKLFERQRAARANEESPVQRRLLASEQPTVAVLLIQPGTLSNKTQISRMLTVGQAAQLLQVSANKEVAIFIPGYSRAQSIQTPGCLCTCVRNAIACVIGRVLFGAVYQHVLRCHSNPDFDCASLWSCTMQTEFQGLH